MNSTATAMDEIWFSDILAFPSLFKGKMDKQMINEKQCFALCTLAEYVAHYASHWWNNWFKQELKSSSAGRVGMELVKGLKKGLQLLQICAAKDSTVVWTILRGAGPFREVIEDVRRYAQIMNRLFASDLEKREIVKQLRHKVEFDCRVLHTSLGYACRLDRITLLEGLKSSNNNGLLLHDTLLSCLISILEKRLLSDIDESNLTEKERVFLGQGTYGYVMKANLYGLPVAVKKFLYKDHFEDEKKIFKEFLKTDYPSHVVGILGCSESSIILELMDKNLKQLIQEKGPSLLFSESIDIMIQIAEGMRFLHGHDVIYRDLKPANVLIQVREGQGRVVIADFGVSKEQFQTELINTSYTGTRLYMAPEMMQEGCSKYSRKVDVHSFGMVCWEILTGKQTDLKPIQLKNGKRPPLPENIPISLGRLIQRCWDHEANKRPKFEEICDELWLVKEKCLTGCITEDVEAALLDDKTELSFSIAGLNCLRIENRWAKLQAQRKATREKWGIDNVNKFNFAITGHTGVGKSSLLNALLGLYPKSEGAAKSDYMGCTMNPTSYTHPHFTNFVFWVLPGAPVETYYEDNALHAFDAIVIVTGDRITAFEVEIAKQSHEAKLPVAFVRSKADSYIREIAIDYDISMADAAKEFEVKMRDHFKAEMYKAGLKGIKLFLVSSRAFYPNRTPYKLGQDKSLQGMDEPLLLQFISEKAANRFPDYTDQLRAMQKLQSKLLNC